MENVISTYYTRISQFIHAQSDSYEQAEDLVQDIFLDIVKLKDRIHQIDHLESYLFTMAKNALRFNWRQKQIKNMAISEEVDLIDEASPNGVDQLSLEELSQQINEIVAQLPMRQQQIFKMSRIQGMAHKEIAHQLNISLHTVNNHMVQSLKTMRKELCL